MNSFFQEVWITYEIETGKLSTREFWESLLLENLETLVIGRFASKKIYLKRIEKITIIRHQDKSQRRENDSTKGHMKVNK